MTFKEKIVKLRKLKGLTQDEFASAVGVSRQAVYKWESGQSYPEVPKLLEIKKLFDISIDDLLDENYEVILPEKKKRKRLSKEVKAAVEAETFAEAPVAKEAPSVADSAKAEEAPVVAEPVKSEPEEAARVAENEPKAEAEAAEEVKEEPKADEDTESDDDGKKKVGFFGRLFGRK